jgi:hypothetical protein
MTLSTVFIFTLYLLTFLIVIMVLFLHQFYRLCLVAFQM